MTLLAMLKLAMVLSIILLLFSLSLRARFSDLAFLVVNWRLGLGAFIAMFVVVPGVAILLDRVFAIDPAVKVALLSLAFSPVPPILPAKQVRAGGRAPYVAGLLFGATIMTLFVAPFGIEIASRVLDVDVDISARALMPTLVVSVLLPLLLGQGLKPLLGKHIERVGAVASRTGSAIMLVGGIVMLVLALPAVLSVIGDGTVLVLSVLILSGLVSGMIFGGRSKSDRIALSLAASTRHPGVAMAIASQIMPASHTATAAILLGLLLSLIICIPFLSILSQGDAA